ncbi:hypothetical protein [Streptomyces uncialis]|uniref:hypothetical protein n=1 Tax=Streptomyces uncialis TaxID=1048205 RepID=UPI00386D67FC|nr:hypothetical protein OG268_04570 [Streptomyces uncialis]
MSAEVDALLGDLALPADVCGAIIAVTVRINETKGHVPGSTASSRCSQQRRVPIGPDGSLSIADADEPHCVLTRVQLY